jgi:hypothetical protein
MQVCEIPPAGKRPVFYRFFEILPGVLSWTILLAPFWLSLISPLVAAIATIAYIIVWFMKGLALDIRIVQGYRRMKKHQKIKWQKLIDELDSPQAAIEKYVHNRQALPFRWHYNNLVRQAAREDVLSSKDLYHAIIVAFYNETRDTLEPTIQSILASNYDMEHVILFLAYEQRGGAASKQLAHELVAEYSNKFAHMQAVEHPVDMPGEVIGKGGNITFAGYELQRYLDKKHIAYERVVVTTLDSDNHPDKAYLPILTYMYLACPDRLRSSFQPIAMYLTNIWDVPAPMRVVATASSIWNIALSGRLHALRNFAAHAQGMAALVQTDFWSTRTIVEDGHQYWRSYFRFDGKYMVYPIFVPIYQDAVLASTLKRTLKMQFVQLRRWAWGASDIAYVAYFGFIRRNRMSKYDLVAKLLRLIEGHVSWASASLVLAYAAMIPLHVARNGRSSIVADQLPKLAGNLQTLALVGVFLTMFVTLVTLPPRPLRYKRRRSFWMVVQWVYMPFTTILYNTLAALYSQTRLMTGRYIGKFDVTEKAVKK